MRIRRIGIEKLHNRGSKLAGRTRKRRVRANPLHCGSITAPQVLTLARESLGEDPRGYRHGFIELVQAYERLTDEFAAQDRR